MAQENYLLGLDIGTTGVKGVLIGPNGQTAGSAVEEYPLSTPRPNWAEQNPEDWWQASGRVMKKLTAGLDKEGDNIKGIGFSGQMHSLVLLDERDKILRPAILWCDTRTDEECRWLNETIGRETLGRLVGNPALEGFTLPKILWVKKHEPDVYKRIRKVMLPKDYIKYRLTGEFTTEVSDASGTLLFDVAHRRWSNEMLKKLEIPGEWLPKVTESIEVCGTTTLNQKGETGLMQGIPVVGGGADNACGAVGSGVVRRGRVSASIGTSGVVLAHSDTLQLDPQMRAHTFCHSVPGAWYVMGVILMAGGAFRWYKDTFAESEREIARSKGIDVYEIITKEAEEVPAGSDGLQFLPYLVGERTPHQSASARASFVGATIRHSRKHFARAVLEGITFAMRDSLEIIKGLGIPVDQVRLTGGGARSKFWRQLQADVYGREVAVVNATEGPAFGAALMAGVGAGVFSDLVVAAENHVRVSEIAKPDAGNVETYNKAYELFKETYKGLAPVYERMHRQFRNHTS